MNEYVLCPKCELNYIKSTETCCKVCNPRYAYKLVSKAEEEYEDMRAKRLIKSQARKESMNAFYAIRYNCKHK